LQFPINASLLGSTRATAERTEGMLCAIERSGGEYLLNGGYSRSKRVDAEGVGMNTTSSISSIALSTLLGLSQISSAMAAPGNTSLVVPSPSSSTATELSLDPFISANGRFVVFRSTAPNLVGTDTNLLADIFLFDRTTDTTTRIANPRTCTEAKSPTYSLSDAAVSSTGRYVLWGIREPCGDIHDETTSLVLLDRQTNTRKVLDKGVERRYRNISFSADENLIVFNKDFEAILLYDISSGQIKLISDAVGEESSPSINADGSVIAYASLASDLVPNDTNGVADIFVYRSATGQTERVSKSSTGVQSNGRSAEPVVSADGAFVAYASDASNLIAGDTNGATDIFVFQLATRVTTRASRSSTNAQLNGSSIHPSISSGGRYVAFSSLAINAVFGDTNDAEDIFVRDRLLDRTSRISVLSTGEETNGNSREPTMSSDGRYVAFLASASNLTANDRNRAADVFLVDRQVPTIFIATKAAKPVAGLGASGPAISADGTQVTFASGASSLVTNDRNGWPDVFVRDYTQGVTIRVSKPTGAGQSNGESFNPSLSRDGRFVAFLSRASNLVPDDTNDREDVFVRDRQNATTERVSVSSTGEQANLFSREAEISGNGRFVLFWSDASNLVPGDGEHSTDLFLRDRVAGTTERAVIDTNGQPIGIEDLVSAISADGRFIAFATTANLHPDDTEFDGDVYLRDRQLGTFERISVPIAGGSPFCCTRVREVAISANGRFVAFNSDARNQVPGDTNDHADVFVRDRQLGTTVRASVLPSDIEPYRQAFSSLSISGDGRHVCFSVFSFQDEPTFVRQTEVICRDIHAGVTKRASVSSSGAAANAEATQSAMSANGRFVAFTSGATNLVTEPIAGETVFRHERSTNLPTFTATPISLAFGTITVGTTSSAKTVRVSNTGSVVVEIASVALIGTNPGQFRIVNNCPTQLAAGEQCKVSVRFKPSSQGAKTAELQITSGVGGAKSILLSGTGT
jgi:Tol biopolymer transport system component